MARTFADPVLAEQARAASLPPAPPCPVLRSYVASTDHIYIIVTAPARGRVFQPRHGRAPIPPAPWDEDLRGIRN
jgi:hypothetical protein